MSPESKNLSQSRMYGEWTNKGSGVRPVFLIAWMIASVVVMNILITAGTELWFLLITAFFFVLPFLSLLQTIHKVFIRDHYALISYHLWRKRTIAYSDIRWIDWHEMKEGGKAILIRLREGKECLIRFTEEDTDELYRALKSAWERTSGADDSKTVMSREEFQAMYKRFKKYVWPLYLSLAVATASILGMIVTLLVHIRNPSSTALWLTGGLALLLSMALALGRVWQKTVLQKYGFQCGKCGTSLTVESGKTMLSTGKCPNCEAVVILPSD